MDSDGTRFDNSTIPDKTACLANNHSWVNSGMNFDHVGKAYLSLFEVAIFKGWTAVLYDAGDSREVKLLKKRKQNSSREMHAFTLAQHFFIGLMQFWVKSQHFSTFIALIQ